MTSFDPVTPIHAESPAMVREIFEAPPLPGCPPVQLEMDDAKSNGSLLRMTTVSGSSGNLGERFEEGFSQGDDPDSPSFMSSATSLRTSETGDGDHGHHHERPPSILTASA